MLRGPLKNTMFQRTGVLNYTAVESSSGCGEIALHQEKYGDIECYLCNKRLCLCQLLPSGASAAARCPPGGVGWGGSKSHQSNRGRSL